AWGAPQVGSGEKIISSRFRSQLRGSPRACTHKSTTPIYVRLSYLVVRVVVSAAAHNLVAKMASVGAILEHGRQRFRDRDPHLVPFFFVDNFERQLLDGGFG